MLTSIIVVFGEETNMIFLWTFHGVIPSTIRRVSFLGSPKKKVWHQELVAPLILVLSCT